VCKRRGLSYDQKTTPAASLAAAEKMTAPELQALALELGRLYALYEGTANAFSEVFTRACDVHGVEGRRAPQGREVRACGKARRPRLEPGRRRGEAGEEGAPQCGVTGAGQRPARELSRAPPGAVFQPSMYLKTSSLASAWLRKVVRSSSSHSRSRAAQAPSSRRS
jgi:hypothetical protein